MGGLICNINKMSLILVAKNESGNKQQANPLHPLNLSKGKAIRCASPYANSKIENVLRVSHVIPSNMVIYYQFRTVIAFTHH